MIVNLEYWDRVKETKQYSTGGYYESQRDEHIRNHDIEGESEIDIFEQFYKLNNQLRYCNGARYEFKDKVWKQKYLEWLQSDDYKSKSFNLYYGNGVVD